MYVCQLSFECELDIELDEAQQAISMLLDQYRYNGQIIGREFPLTLVDDKFEITFVCPEQDSLAVKYNNDSVLKAFEQLKQLGLSTPKFTLKGLECQSDFSDTCDQPKALVLYSTYVQSCSPLRCLEHFAPVPLYKMPEQVRKPLIKWQESQAACDQLQMNEITEIELFAIEQLSQLDSELLQNGNAIAKTIQQQINVPVYQYLYRVGGESLQAEQQRCCPSCDGDWLLIHEKESEQKEQGKIQEPLHGLFDFKCDKCLLVSNVSWDHQ